MHGVFAWHRWILAVNTFVPISFQIITVSHWKGKGARKVDIASSYEGIGPCHAQDALANLGEEQQLDEEDKLILDDEDDEPDSFEINLKKW